MITHTVQRGETLRTISDSYGYDYDQILQLNPYASPAPRADAIIQLVVPMTGDVLTGEADEPMTW